MEWNFSDIQMYTNCDILKISSIQKIISVIDLPATLISFVKSTNLLVQVVIQLIVCSIFFWLSYKLPFAPYLIVFSLRLHLKNQWIINGTYIFIKFLFNNLLTFWCRLFFNKICLKISGLFILWNYSEYNIWFFWKFWVV